MWRIGLTLGVAALLTACLPAGLEAACAQCGGSGGLYAVACGAPGYGSLSPGCCEHVPSSCDRIWDGYCQEEHGFPWGRLRELRPALRCRPALGRFQRVGPACAEPACAVPVCQPGENVGDVIEEGPAVPAAKAPEA